MRIRYGKDTIEYKCYFSLVPWDQKIDDMPTTPKIYFRYSRKQWNEMMYALKNGINDTVAKLELLYGIKEVRPFGRMRINSPSCNGVNFC